MHKTSPRPQAPRKNRRELELRAKPISERLFILNQPRPSYHGAVWTEAIRRLGPIAPRAQA
jgi:hypothetical protein